MDEETVSRHSSQIDNIYSRVESEIYVSKNTAKIMLIRSPSRNKNVKKDVNMRKLSSLPEAQFFKAKKSAPIIPQPQRQLKPSETLVHEKRKLAVQKQLLKALESGNLNQPQQSHNISAQQDLTDAQMRAIALNSRIEHANASKLKKEKVKENSLNISKQRQLSLEDKKRKALETKLEEEFMREAKRENQIEQTMKTQQLRTQSQLGCQVIQDKVGMMQEKIRLERYETEKQMQIEADQVKCEREFIQKRIEELKEKSQRFNK
ncbi:hypothetical protein SS50377_23707 [Spironucleus salmonicida]|uniref:Uncharacterized protein n=1 Tax=Spironucleus salmonicida TaxID=348837 RepID=V6M5S8_9EUKA|nr:hypothetical protein SS50377_23707 [Spironucleus salmonicida]|eukprot:EST48689.1 Hypothetical protein SS50377_11302 [Spironucleus salmonicida]